MVKVRFTLSILLVIICMLSVFFTKCFWLFYWQPVQWVFSLSGNL